MKCRCCGSQTHFFENVSNCQYEQFDFKKNPFKAKLKDITLYKCPYCSHVQSEYNLADNFYDTYSSYEGVAQYAQSDELAEKRISHLLQYAPDADSLLEIGSGIGSFLRIARKTFKNVIGVEPSQNALLCNDEDITVIQDYFGKNTVLPEYVRGGVSVQ